MVIVERFIVVRRRRSRRSRVRVRVREIDTGHDVLGRGADP
jgi:hypothetical protein